MAKVALMLVVFVTILLVINGLPTMEETLGIENRTRGTQDVNDCQFCKELKDCIRCCKRGGIVKCCQGFCRCGNCG
ncbi:hypothetical protein ACHQM5_024856 [Ranunculus cassubicifolius]